MFFYSLIDTAEIYAAGQAERIVAKAMKDYDRQSLFLVSKVNALNLRNDDLIRSAKASIKRMRVKFLDLYLIH